MLARRARLHTSRARRAGEPAASSKDQRLALEERKAKALETIASAAGLQLSAAARCVNALEAVAKVEADRQASREFNGRLLGSGIVGLGTVIGVAHHFPTGYTAPAAGTAAFVGWLVLFQQLGEKTKG